MLEAKIIWHPKKNFLDDYDVPFPSDNEDMKPPVNNKVDLAMDKSIPVTHQKMGKKNC